MTSVRITVNMNDESVEGEYSTHCHAVNLSSASALAPDELRVGHSSVMSPLFLCSSHHLERMMSCSGMRERKGERERFKKLVSYGAHRW